MRSVALWRGFVTPKYSYFRQIREIRHFRPLKKSGTLANALQLLALLILQVSANVISCYETGMTDFTNFTELVTSLFYCKYILGIY